jgi:Tfp pilus assembly protein PilF
MDAVMMNAGYSNEISWLYQAEHELQHALVDDPNSARAHSALAAVYFMEGRKDLVPMEAERALSLNPNELDALNWLCDYYVRSGEYAKAQSVADQVLEKDPLVFPTRVNLAFSFEASGHPAKALEQLQKVLELDAQNVPALTALGETYMNAGQLPNARKTLERVGSRDRDNYAVRLDWGRLLALEGKRAAALAKVDDDVLKYAAANSVDGTARLVAEFFATCGEQQKSLDWLELAVRNGDEEREWFERDPLLVPIRNQPRFERLMNSISLRQQQSTRG